MVRCADATRLHEEQPVVNDVTKKYRDLLAYGLLAVASLALITGLSLIFKSGDDLGANIGFAEKAALFGSAFESGLIVLPLVGAVFLVTRFGELSRQARIVVLAALALGAVALLFGLITFFAQFGADTGLIRANFSGIAGAGKTVGVIAGLAQLLFLAVALGYVVTTYRGLPAPVAAPMPQWGAGQQGWGQQGWGQPGWGQPSWGQPGWGSGQQQGWGHPAGPPPGWGPPPPTAGWAQPDPTGWGQPHGNPTSGKPSSPATPSAAAAETPMFWGATAVPSPAESAQTGPADRFDDTGSAEGTPEFDQQRQADEDPRTDESAPNGESQDVGPDSSPPTSGWWQHPGK
jgi:FtsH-binding integral membrane protein